MTSHFRYATLAGVISSAMLFSASPSGAEEITIPNNSFESPYVKEGWYAVPDLSTSEDFVWQNNLGQYGLAGKGGANHYTVAGDGSQAIRLGRGMFVSQTLGATAPETIYTLSFSILQSKRQPDPGAAVKAEIIDGGHFIASQIFRVPAEVDVWETVTLTGKPVHTATGKLSIKFTGSTTEEDGIGPWIDNITLTAAAVSPGTGLVNPSFETPVVAESWWEESIPDSFGWENNLNAFALARKGPYSAADDGSQALHLGRGSFISQKVGPTLPDTSYKLTFSLLQNNYQPNPGASLEAEIYDGENPIGSEVFKVPDEVNVWQTFSLTANSPHAPSGELTIKFTGKTGGGSKNMGPMLDNISLTAAPVAGAKAGM